MAKFKWRDLYGGGAFRWLLRAVVFGALAIVVILNRLLNVHIILSLFISSTLFFIGVTVLYVLVLSGRLKVKL